MENKGLIYSLILHLILFIFLVVGLPHLWHPAPEEVAVSIEIVPVTGKTNVKQRKVNAQAQTADKTKDVKKAAEQKEEVKEPEVKKQQKNPDKQEKAEQKPKVEDSESKKEANESLKKENKPKEKEDKKEQAKKEHQEEKNKEVKKEEKKKEEKKKKKRVVDEDAVLNNLEESTTTEKHNKKKSKKLEKNLDDLEQELNDKSDSPEFNASDPLSMSEKDAIRSQIEKLWNIPAGAKDAKDMIVVLRIWLNLDGSVVDVKPVSTNFSGNPAFRAAVESAIRAVHMASPLKNLPTNKYDSWKDIEMSFNPSSVVY